MEGTLQFAEYKAIVDALAHCNHCRSAAAARLKISRSTLYRLMSKYQICSVSPITAAQAQRITQPRDIGTSAFVEPENAAPQVIFEHGVWYLVPSQPLDRARNSF